MIAAGFEPIVSRGRKGAHAFAFRILQPRGALKKLFPTCKQPTPQELAAAAAFKKKQQEIYDANVAKANPQAAAPANGQSKGQPNNRAPQSAQGFARPAPPKNEEERAMRRCVSSGRLPATCTGNSLLGAFGQMVGQVLPGANKEPAPGPEIAGVFEGAGNWRIDFIDKGVLVNCADLSPDQHKRPMVRSPASARCRSTG